MALLNFLLLNLETRLEATRHSSSPATVEEASPSRPTSFPLGSEFHPLWPSWGPYPSSYIYHRADPSLALRGYLFPAIKHAQASSTRTRTLWVRHS